MATAPRGEIQDQAFLAEQRARLRAERDELARAATRLAAELNGVMRPREALGAHGDPTRISGEQP